jgi:hypothetical protein
MQPSRKLISSFYASTDQLIDYISKGRYKTSCFQFKNVIDPELAKIAVASLENNLFNLGSNPLEKRHKYFFACDNAGFGRRYHTVHFNEKFEPKPIDESTNWSEAAVRVVNIALKRFGQELKLKGPHEVGIAFVQTGISVYGTGNFRWQTDEDTSWTMRTLLSDRKDRETGWKGGKMFRSTYYLQKDPIGIVQPQSSIQSFKPVIGGSILYHNINAMRLFTEMNPRKEFQRTTCTELVINLKDKANKGFLETPYIKTDDEVDMDTNFFEPGNKFI